MNTMKFSLLSAVVAFLLAACSDQMPSAESSASGQSGSGAVYNVVRDFVYEPYLMKSESGEMGFEIDVLEAVAKQQGFGLSYTKEPWEKLFSDLSNKNIHIILGGTSLEEVDQSVALPSRPYMVSFDCVVAKDESDIKDWQNKKIIVLSTGPWEDNLRTKYGVSEENLSKVKTNYEILRDMLNKNIPIGVGDCVSLRYSISSPTFAKYPFSVKELPDSVEDDSTRIVFSVRKDEPELLAKINAGLEALQKNGELDAIKARWKQ